MITCETNGAPPERLCSERNAMMRLASILVISAVILGSVLVCCADTGSSRQSVRIAAFNFYPAIFQAKDGTVQGFYVDFLNEIAKRERWNIEYINGSWVDGLDRIKTGGVDVLTNVAFTTERETFMDFGKVPLLTVWAELYALSGSHIDGIRDVKDKKIAVMKGDYNAANFKNLIEKLEINCQIVEYSSFEDVFKAIVSRQVDGGVVNNTFGTAKQSEYGVKSTGVIFNPFDIYFTVAKGKNNDILKTLDQYLSKWRPLESSPYHQARERWSHKSVSTMRVIPQWSQNTMIILAIASGLFIAFICILRFQIKRKTAELEKQAEERIMIEDLLRFLNESGAQHRGTELLSCITRYLGNLLKVEYVFVSKLLSCNRVKTVGLCSNGTTGNEFEYDLHGTPCENVIGKKLCMYPEKVSLQFPEDTLLKEISAEGYAATPLRSSQGLPIGLLAIVSKAPLINLQQIEAIIQIAATRITQEFESMNRLDEIQSYSQRLELATRATQSGVWDWNLKDNTLLWDRRMFELYGFTKMDSYVDIEAWKTSLHPEDREPVWAECQAALRGKMEWDFDCRILLPDGTVRHISSNALVIRDPEGNPIRVLGTNRDITEQKNAERAIKESKFFFEESQRAASIGSYKTDFVHGTWESSKVLDTIFGIDENYTRDVQGWLDLISPDDREMMGQYIFEEVVSNHKNFDKEYRIVRKDTGELRWVHGLGKVNLGPSGTVISMYGTIHDITSRKQAAEEHDKLQEQLNQVQRLDSVGRLAGGIAHDFNNKLTVILGYTELFRMLQCTMNKECSDYINEIDKAAQYSREITKRLLAFSRTDSSNKLKLNLNSLLKETKRTLGRMIGEHIAFEFKLQDDLWFVRTDPTHFDQIITNLVVNARDALVDGGIVTMSTANVCFSEDHLDVPAGEYVVVSCSDTGCGMDSETIKHIFEPFFTTKEVGKGTGLGLASVYGLVKQNDGYIDVQSKPGKGSKFSIFLPRFIDEESNNNLIRKNDNKLVGSGTILLVEDEVEVQKITELMLKTMGYNIVTASTPNQAITLCSDLQHSIDCVLSDIIMPEMDGLAMKERITAICPELPFVFISGYTPDIIRERLQSSGNFDVLQKPINFKQLRNVLNNKMHQ